MPARQASVAVTDLYRSHLLDTRQKTVQAAMGAWLRMNPDDLSGSFATWLAATGALVQGAQMAGVALTRQYLSAYVASETGRRATTPTITAEDYVGRDVFGRSLAVALTPPLLTVKVRIGQGATPGAALAQGANRASRLIASAAMAAPRVALSDAIEGDDRLIGWRRCTSGNACGACLGAATGAIQRDAETLLVHDECRCGKEPVVKGVRERVQRPTGSEVFASKTTAEQDALFAGRGGADKAELIRSGQVDLSQLITHEPLALGGAALTETPLSALVPAAAA